MSQYLHQEQGTCMSCGQKTECSYCADTHSKMPLTDPVERARPPEAPPFEGTRWCRHERFGWLQVWASKATPTHAPEGFRWELVANRFALFPVSSSSPPHRLSKDELWKRVAQRFGEFLACGGPDAYLNNVVLRDKLAQDVIRHEIERWKEMWAAEILPKDTLAALDRLEDAFIAWESAQGLSTETET